MNKDPRLTDTQKVLFALPTLTLIFLILLILLNKKIRRSPGVYISLALSAIHLYHHYTLDRLQNKV